MSIAPRSDAFRAIGWGGLIAGALDISDALIFYGLRGVPAERLLQGIAAGLLGPIAIRDGWPTALFGLAIHFVIAFVASAVYYAFSRRLRVLRERPILSGLLYGIAVFLVMNMIVVPASALHRSPTALFVFTFASANAILALMIFIGLPIAFAVHFFASRSMAEE